jgi:hypothetical protein
LTEEATIINKVIRKATGSENSKKLNPAVKKEIRRNEAIVGTTTIKNIVSKIILKNPII